MPASLKFVVALLGCGVVGAVASGVVQRHEATSQARQVAEAITGGNVEAGEAAITRYGCGSCHIIPGIANADGRVGPSLRALARRAVIAGKRVNDPAELERWIAHPQQISPGNAMPEQSIPDRQVRDIAAYLYTLRQ